MARTPRISRHLRFGLFGLAALFFANPNIAVIDLLPDVFGYLLLWLSLGYTADLHSRLAEAREGFLRMAMIDAIKLVSLFWLITMTSNEEQPTAQLLLTFVFGVLELIYALPAWRNFFDGMFGLISTDGDLRRYDLVSRGRKGKIRRVRSLPEVLRSATTAWFVWRVILTTLPEMTALSAFEHSGYVTNFDRDIYEFRGLFVFFAVSAMLTIGLVWLVRMLRFAHRLRTDTGMIDKLKTRYAEEVLVDEGLFMRRRIKLGLTLATLGALLSIDFYVEERNIIPDLLAVAFFVAAILVLRHCSERWRLPLAFCNVWGVASGFSTFCEHYFHSEFYPSLVYKNSEAYARYQLMCAATVVEQIAFAAAMVGFFLLLYGIVRSVGRDMREELGRKLISWLVLAILSAVSGVLYDLLLPSVEFIWLIDFTLGLAFAGYAWKGFGDITESLAIAIRDRIPNHERTEH